MHTPDFLETSPALAADGPSLAGRAIGAYTLDAPIGMGGMGAVWRAHRSDGRFEGQVAIKLLNVALLDPAGSARFQREGTILARLTHPHIARLLDAGLWITGQPFLVLEYIAGRPIDAYAAHHRLALPDRLALVQQVIAAVAHAHAHLVVHRDLKPSNILVTPAGDVKLLDFGIAALLDPAAPGAATLPQALTPEFAAPEQVDGQPVSTATDIYALGVLLYRLLTGRHPTGDGCTTAAQYARALADVEPRLASASVQAGDAALAAALAAERGTTPARLARALRGDLDTILATALRKAPAARYASVTALGDDLRRALAHEPVAARPIPWPHRALRAVRRHRVAATAAALVATTLAGATVITARQAADAARQRDAAVASARRAEASSDVLSFLVSQIGNRPMTMREVLDRARVALEKQYANTPEVLARMLTQLSGRYQELNEPRTVLDILERVRELSLPLNNPLMMASVECDLAETAADLGELDAARRHLADGQRYLGQLTPRPTGVAVECLISAQSVAVAGRRYEDAVAPALEAIAILEAEGKTSTTLYSSALNTASNAFDALDRKREALVYQGRITALLERIGRDKTAAMGVNLHNQALTLWDLGRWRDADETYRRALGIVGGFDQAAKVPSIYIVTYGRLLVQLGRDDEAQRWLARGLAMEPGPSSLHLRAISAMADLHMRRGALGQARAALDEVSANAATLAPRPLLEHRLRVARLEALEGKSGDARAHVDEALATIGYPARTDAASLYRVLVRAADIALLAGDAATAERMARDAVAASDRACGSDVPSALRGEARLVRARSLAALGTPQPGLATDAASLIAGAAGSDHPLVRLAGGTVNAPGKDRWQAVSPLLDEALELAPAEREAFIAALAQRAAPLAQLLARLLDQHDRLLRSDFLETSPALAADGPSLAGRAIGAYTLDAPIGMGGMGAVWRAHRSDGRFEGQVAIKLLNVALLDPAGSARFQREGTILARLTHPHIARLLDAGLWITGQPFLVLEYIAGRPIDAYAAHHRLALPDRLALVQQVIAAVAHAHAHLVVHRDLKPSNILVTPAGDVKLLDFGIAALLDPAAPGAATLPQALTPEFAAPEQVDGQPVSTATDIYALGVLLYRLLTGRHPTGDGCTTAAQYARALADVEPRLASASVQAGDAARAAALAAERGTTPARLARALRGDLDTILATALRKAPAARYASVTALGDDLRRALAHEPVAARPIPWPHRALRAVRRHRVAATAAALVATTLAGATVITARQAADAARQRDAAVASARRAEASSEFLSFLVSQIGNRPMTMREVLDRARVALEKQYTGEPETVARMLVQMSGRYMELHDQPAVLATLTRALEVATPLDRPELHAAINCDIAEWHADNHDTATARRFHAQALAALQRVAQPPTGLLVECLLTEQAIAETDQRFNDAVVPAQRAVALLEAEGNTSSTRYTSALNSLTLTLDNLDRHRESLVLRRRVIDTLERIGRGRTSAMAVSLHNLAFSEVSVGRWLDAVDTYTRVVDIIRGSDATGGMPAIYAVTYGRMLLQAGRDAEAEAWLARGLATVEDADAPIRLRGLSGQFDLALRRGDRAAARALADRLGPLTAALPPASVRDHTMRMARLALLEGDVAAARRLVDAVLSAERYGPGTSSAALYLVLPEAADIVVATGDAATGERYARDAIALAEQACGSDAASAHVGAAHLALARALEAQGRRADAAPHAATALDLLTRSAGAGHPLTRDARTLTAS